MNIPQDELNRWAQEVVHINGLLLGVQNSLRRCETAAAQAQVEQTRQINWTRLKKLMNYGAENPIEANLERLRVELDPDEAETLPAREEVPLHLLSSESNRRFARALREAYEALLEVERERGITDGPSETMAEDLAAVEMEVYGPVGSGRE